MAIYLAGSPIAVIGDPTVALGASMYQMSEVEEATIDLGVANGFVTLGSIAGAITSDGVYTLPPDASITIRLNDASIDVLQKIMVGGQLFTDSGDDAYGIGGAIELLTLPTLGIIPIWERSAGVDAPNAWWFPGVFPQDFNNILYNRMQRNGSVNNQYSVTFRAARTKVTQAADAIPEKARHGWVGKPSAFAFATLPYTLPALT